MKSKHCLWGLLPAVVLVGVGCSGSNGTQLQGYFTGTVACKSDCTLDLSACHNCGNSILDSGEQCDGSQLVGGKTCTTQGFYAGTLKCSSDCKSFDTSGCHKCGNGTFDSGEQCDGSQLGGKTCVTQGFTSGTLACNSDCTFDTLACNVGTHVSIAAGTFTMGSPMGSPTSEPCRLSEDEDQHQVTLTHGFEISAYEITQGEFQAVMGYNPASFTSCGTSCPVEKVNWHEAAAYCNTLSTKKGLAQCYTCSGSEASVICSEASAYSGQKTYTCPGYRLPTEAEWEHAYRAGTTTAFYNGTITSCSTDANADKIGWYFSNSGSTTHPVGQKQANAWGLYDMAGNVWEWCHDGYQSSLGSSAVTDPVGSGSSYRVVRGGYWKHNANLMRAAYRFSLTPTYQYNYLGFRCSVTK